MFQKPILETKGLCKRFGKRLVARDVSFSILPGEIVGLLGHNGAGKTTVFSMLIGLQAPTAGEIFFRGENITRTPIYERALRGMGYLAQEPTVFRMLTVRENLQCALDAQKLPKEKGFLLLNEMLEEMNLTAFQGQKAHTLSGGEKRRVEIARSLLTNPSVLLLDEPFANIDPITISELKTLLFKLKERGIAIVITDHNAREILSLVDKSIILNHGMVLFIGSRMETLASKEVRTAYLGTDFTL